MSEINIGQLSEAINDKADRNLQNVDTTAKADAVIDYQEPTADNGYTWYRKYASGWVEQGGYVAATSSSIMSKAVSLPITMANSNYQVSKTTHMGASTTNSSEWGWWGDKPSSASANTTTTVYLSVASTSFCMGVFWQVNGLSAN